MSERKNVVSSDFLGPVILSTMRGKKYFELILLMKLVKWPKNQP